MIRSLLPAALLFCCLCASSASGASSNLIANGEFEGAGASAAQELPKGWEPLNIGAPAKIAADSTDRHGGQASVRIDAAEVTRAYVRSTAGIEVAPGETIDASAWVKARDVPADKGTVIMIAEFADAAGGHLGVEKFNTLNTKKPTNAWQQL